MPDWVKWLATSVRRTAAAAQRGGDLLGGPKGPLVVSDGSLSDAEREDVLRRMQFYAPWFVDGVEFATRLRIADVLSTRPLLFRDVSSPLHSWLRRIRGNTFDVSATNPQEAWQWASLNRETTRAVVPADARERFERYLDRLAEQRLAKCYLFGTGPSLALAGDRDWSDGYRVVCNTIVRDEALWDHIRPHFVVAADAVYHFGFTAFARRFRADLRARLETGDTMFIYPDIFHGIVVDELGDFADRLVPVPLGRHKSIRVSLRERFELPGLGNVLNLIMLPLGCTLSKNVFLWGFDGRAPKDQLFWANSSKQSYPELMDTLRAAHPAFFDHFVPADKPAKYVNTVHGDELDRCLSDAEADGWSLVMLHKTWTPTLQKRYRA